MAKEYKVGDNRTLVVDIDDDSVWFHFHVYRSHFSIGMTTEDCRLIVKDIIQALPKENNVE